MYLRYKYKKYLKYVFQMSSVLGSISSTCVWNTTKHWSYVTLCVRLGGRPNSL